MTFIAEDVREILAQMGFESLDQIIVDLNPVLAQVDRAPVLDSREGRINVPDTLDPQIIKDAAQLFNRGEKTHLTYSVQSTHRAVGTRTSSHIYQKFGAEGLTDGHLTVRLRGSAGQSLGAFGMTGLRLIVDGDANDYVGKGLSGAEIIVSTKGTLMAAGRAGERFAVRNSGAKTVVEGLGTNGCEYMTGGVVVVLGSVGDNFGAGMTQNGTSRERNSGRWFQRKC